MPGHNNPTHPPHARRTNNPQPLAEEGSDDDSEDFSNDEDIPLALQSAIIIVGKNSKEVWHKHLHKTIHHNLSKPMSYTTHLASHAMVCYFTNRPPLLQDFRD